MSSCRAGCSGQRVSLQLRDKPVTIGLAWSQDTAVAVLCLLQLELGLC
jgi:hypothetical protein